MKQLYQHWVRLISCTGLLLFALNSMAQQVTVSGKVTDKSNGQGLPGVNVIVKGTSLGTTTDGEGDYTLTVAGGNSTLVFSYIGYLTQEAAINNQSTVNVSLDTDIKSLDEVVVVGYGTVKKRDLTGAVASVKADEIPRNSTVTVDNLLQGQVAGLVVTGGTSGAPGSRTTIRIRGSNSINGGNDPLLVIDGIPITDNENAITRYTSDGFAPKSSVSSTLASINPDDIESMEVLKDASATAIYGARGANGVILVTTKRGKQGTSTLTFNTEFSLQKPLQLYELLNAQQFMELNNEARAQSSPAQPVLYPDLQSAYDTDWQKEVINRQAGAQNYSLAARGGTEKLMYTISANYFNQSGLVKSNDLKRYSLRFNIDNQATRWLKLGTSTVLTRTTSQLFTSYNSVIASVPIQPVFYNGVYSTNAETQANSDLNLRLTSAGVTPIARNPVYDINNVDDRLIQNRILSNTYAEFNIIDQLKFKTSLAVDLLDAKYQSYAPGAGTLNTNGGDAFTAFTNTFDYIFENALSYSKTLQQHDLNAVVVQNIQEHQEGGFSSRGQSLNDITGYNNYAGNTLVDQVAVPSASRWTIASFLGRINYSFRQRYLATVSFRADGSSRFGAGNKWGYFPSGSLAWIVTEENFLKGLPAVSQLKLRVSYGITGSQDIGLYNSLSTMGTVQYVLNNNNALGREPNRSPNPDLSWEETRQTDLGFDLGLFENRISVTGDVYRKKTVGLLYSLSLPYTTGFVNITQNIGSVQNQGIELSANARILDGPFSWSANGNVSRNWNKILSLGGTTDNRISGDFILQVGQPLNSYYGYLTNGLFQEGDDFTAQPNATPGERKYIKTDTSPDANPVINGDDRVIIGNSTPRVTYGLTNQFSFKGFDLSVFLQGVQGVEIYNNEKVTLESTSGRANASTAVLNRWTPTNTSTNIPKAMQVGSRNGSYGSNLNDYFVEDGSYLSIKNITLGYTLPAAMIRKLNLSQLRVYISGQNLANFNNYTGADPNNTGFYPSVRSLSAGLNLGL
jgi:TonB-dependent starch-binding outer membrane protein SusC